MEQAVYLKNGMVQITRTDGTVVTVPDDSNNRHIRALDETGVDIRPYTPPSEAVQRLEFRRSATMTRWGFAEASAARDYITFDEAADWINSGTLPQKIIDVVNSLPPEKRAGATFRLKTMVTVERNGSLMPQVIAAYDTTESPCDDVIVDEMFGFELEAVDFPDYDDEYDGGASVSGANDNDDAIFGNSGDAIIT